jgi:hypothetical protein
MRSGPRSQAWNCSSRSTSMRRFDGAQQTILFVLPQPEVAARGHEGFVCDDRAGCHAPSV